MRREPIAPLFDNLVILMNVAGVVSLTGILGHLLEAVRQGAPLIDAMETSFAAWIWSIELWTCSVWSSRRLLRSGHLDLAASTALLPTLSLLGIKLLRAF